ncbi:1,4-alpha-glucan branching enzyme GlgB [Clostridia bacterium]|nr:1,4-alpha-glucan branching enzyme GlgB [Clostridia bacterium]
MARFSELDMYLFGQSTHYDIYQKMGAHPGEENGTAGVYFTVWAPHAKSVSVVGSFNGWSETANYMTKLGPIGVYETFVPNVAVNDLYKYCIEPQQGKKFLKSDPYANFAENRPGTASKVTDISKFKWTDKKWMQKRGETKTLQNKPMAIYEIHPGSWRRHAGSADEGFYGYRELAHALVDYVKEVGYTHVELMGIAEYPFDGSWGYQVTGYYAPTSRYGTPEEFAYLVNHLHKNNIGVILDWVPAHFPRDAHGLADFDGSPLYEYADPRKGEHPDWGTKIFDYGRNEVKNFLIGSALLWVEHYHIDGLRVDAVASMLYLDYGKNDGQWVANKYGENKNLDAIEFFRHLNSLIIGRHPGVAMIAEESTAWPMVTGAAEKGGLNFNFKWNMGWMHDFLEYMKMDPYFRSNPDNHYKMTFAMSYNGAENYILTISHDEVVHLKGSMLTKMPGELPGKFSNLKVAYAFMIGHAGKKLLFMGQEFGQEREWSEERELDWFLLAKPEHQQVHNFYKALLKIYNKYPALYELDNSPEGFAWINPDDKYRSIFSFVRKGVSEKNNVLFVCNFTPVEYEDYRVGVPQATAKRSLKLLLSSDEKQFGGSGRSRVTTYKPEKQECDGQDYSIAYPLSAYGVAVFVY